MSKSLRDILEEYRLLREQLQRAHSNMCDSQDTMEFVRERLRTQLLAIRREKYEHHGAPFGPSDVAIEIWGQCHQYTTRN